MTDSIHRPIRILLVEDNPGDIRLTREALREGKIHNELDVVTDGVAALEYLRQGGEFEGAHRPDLVLLDLNLPKKDGREVLAELKGDPVLRSIPVVVLTTSDSEADILESYDLHANCYLTKPVAYERFLEVVKATEDFWLSIVRLPGDHSAASKAARSSS